MMEFGKSRFAINELFQLSKSTWKSLTLFSYHLRSMVVVLGPWLWYWVHGCGAGSMVVVLGPWLWCWVHGCGAGSMVVVLGPWLWCWVHGCGAGSMVVVLGPWLWCS